MTESESIPENTIKIIKDAITDDHININKIKKNKTCEIIKKEFKYLLDNTFTSNKYDLIANKDIKGRNFILEVFNDTNTKISSYDRGSFAHKMFLECNVSEYAVAANTELKNKTGVDFCPVFLHDSFLLLPFTTRQIFYLKSTCWHGSYNDYND